MKTNRKISQAEGQRQARQRAMSIARFSEDYAIGRTTAYEELKSGRLRGLKSASVQSSAKTTPRLGSGNCQPFK